MAAVLIFLERTLTEQSNHEEHVRCNVWKNSRDDPTHKFLGDYPSKDTFQTSKQLDQNRANNLDVLNIASSLLRGRKVIVSAVDCWAVFIVDFVQVLVYFGIDYLIF